jgi:hypothetical protein
MPYTRPLEVGSPSAIPLTGIGNQRQPYCLKIRSIRTHFSRSGIGEGLLKLPHQLFPLLHLGVKLIGFLPSSRRKAFVHFHDHEHPFS